MKVLIIGGGGREHAIAEAFAQNNEAGDICVAPGNAGIAIDFPCLELHSNPGILAWCEAKHPDFVFVGPEKYLAEGLSDLLTEHGFNCIGPSQAAARIETSKIFAKDLMARHSIPTAAYATFSNAEQALSHVRKQDKYPIVIKADGLASGKGVAIAQNEAEAQEAILSLDASLGQACGLVIEEFLQGWETSLFVITDGSKHQSTLFAQDHKQLLDGDLGPNTGGMGAFCPVPQAEPYRAEIEATIISPILKAMRDEGCPYRGILYAGLMITAEGPKVLEFNCRMGDPETQALLPLLDTPLGDVCQAIANGQVDRLKLEWKGQHCICVVLAAAGYPGKAEQGRLIEIQPGLHSKAYFSGVEKADGKLVTNGGRVLSLVSVAGSLEQARCQVYRDIEGVDFAGKQYRKDISRRSNQL